ncbi:hypothetical protein V8C37DRAFT_408451 [Trichoderma ceciliae]
MENTCNDPRCCREMVLRRQIRGKGVYWHSIPLEVRLMILEAVIHKKHPGWAAFASVCKEWQRVIEKVSFYEFKYMVTQERRDRVQHIWLNIELLRYDCRSCKSYESDSMRSCNKAIIKTAIINLFAILNHEEDGGDVMFGRGSARKPSEVPTKWNDLKHGWVDGQQVEAPGTIAILRLFNTTDSFFLGELPRVNAVTSFVIRRQLRRWLFPMTLQLLLDKMPCLDSMVYEPWRAWHYFNDDLSAALNNDQSQWHNVDALRVPDPRIGEVFASKSLDLEQLSASYMIDAEHFFQKSQPSWTWHQSQSLSLTSQLLRPTASRKGADLLYNAGVAALNMPKLHTMLLWHGRKGEACAFIYRKGNGNPPITWRATWDLDLCLKADVVEAWEKVALKFASAELHINQQRVQKDIASHGDAIYYLDLPCRVIDPVSLWQIRREGGWTGS